MGDEPAHNGKQSSLFPEQSQAQEGRSQGCTLGSEGKPLTEFEMSNNAAKALKENKMKQKTEMGTEVIRASRCPHCGNLTPVPEVRELDGYLNVYQGPYALLTGGVHSTGAEAAHAAKFTRERIACVRIKQSFTVGEGL